jgi:hypothetical protein
MAIRSLKNGTFSRSLLIGNDAYIPGDFYSIATVTVGAGGASSVTFSSIPQTYTHLQIRSFHKMGAGAYGEITLNSGSWARRHYSYGDGATAYGGTDTANAIFTSGTLYWSPTICDLLDYTSTSKNRVYRVLNGGDNNGSGVIHLFGGLDTTTTPTTSITITATSGGNFAQYSRFALYGVK